MKRQFARYVHREHMIGAYYRDEMIGLIMLGNAGRFGVTGQIISSIKHRDKATNNALIAKAVEVCEKAGLEYLVYLFWSDDSLSEFKRPLRLRAHARAPLLRASDDKRQARFAGGGSPRVERHAAGQRQSSPETAPGSWYESREK